MFNQPSSSELHQIGARSPEENFWMQLGQDFTGWIPILSTNHQCEQPLSGTQNTGANQGTSANGPRTFLTDQVTVEEKDATLFYFG